MRARFGVEKLGVEALLVLVSSEVLLEGYLHGFVHKIVDVDAGKEGMLHDLISISIRTQSSLLVLVQ